MHTVLHRFQRLSPGVQELLLGLLDPDLDVATIYEDLVHPWLQWQLRRLKLLQDALRIVPDHLPYASTQSASVRHLAQGLMELLEPHPPELAQKDLKVAQLDELVLEAAVHLRIVRLDLIALSLKILFPLILLDAPLGALEGVELLQLGVAGAAGIQGVHLFQLPLGLHHLRPQLIGPLPHLLGAFRGALQKRVQLCLLLGLDVRISSIGGEEVLCGFRLLPGRAALQAHHEVLVRPFCLRHALPVFHRPVVRKRSHLGDLHA
mmetsp:Transcript_20349/g.58996  ORF Transcript_20349/g.58996 Transcript_20349/m.58996 type:complete len:263 (+) Transcript_20349:550-1338(+)